VFAVLNPILNALLCLASTTGVFTELMVVMLSASFEAPDWPSAEPVNEATMMIESPIGKVMYFFRLFI
jgi:hypothetical protein